MKKYLIKIALFFAIIAVVDFAFGKACDYLREHTKGGFSGNVHYICEHCNEDVIMMGSSRMRHHYVPRVFEDTLGMTCYNTGIDGNGIILSYGFLEMILERYSPRLIIYDVTGFDMHKSDNTKFLSGLKHYYNREGISEIFNDIQPNEKFKMYSKMYQYNSDLLGLIGDNIHPAQTFEKGYWPAYKVMNYDPVFDDSDNNKEVDSIKLDYVRKFISLVQQHGITLVFAASPTWFGSSLPEYHNPVVTICDQMQVPFINHYGDSIFCSNKEYWADASHLNNDGAVAFSSLFAHELKTLFNTER